MMQSVVIAEDAQIVNDLLNLHHAGPAVIDLTYGHGRFWARLGMTEQTRVVTGIDLRHPRDLDTPRFPVGPRLRASLTALPFKDKTFDASTCDPPFLILSGSAGKMGQRYDSPGSYKALLDLMKIASTETHRILTNRGIAVIKTMDTTDGRRRRWFHADVQSIWEARGWRQDDLIVKIGMTNIRNPSWKYQTRSKSAHCYFLVFKKTLESTAKT